MNLTRLKSGIWQVELRVPVDVRHVLGKTRFAKSTRTQDKRTAMRLAAPVLADWQEAIEAPGGKKQGTPAYCLLTTPN